MDTANLLSSFGLVLDIIGAFLIFIYGIPQKIDRDGHISIIAEQEDESEKELAKTYDLRSNVGLCLLMFGFLLQLIANYI